MISRIRTSMHILSDFCGTCDISIFYCVYIVWAKDHYIKIRTTILNKVGDQLTNIWLPNFGHGPDVKQLNLCVSVFQVTYVVVSI